MLESEIARPTPVLIEKTYTTMEASQHAVDAPVSHCSTHEKEFPLLLVRNKNHDAEYAVPS